MADNQSDDKIDAALAAGQQIQPIAAPTFYATNFQISTTSNSCSITVQRAVPAIVHISPTEVAQVGSLMAAAIVDMSPQSLKDLAVLLQGAVEGWEREYGEIVTDFTRKRAS